MPAKKKTDSKTTKKKTTVTKKSTTKKSTGSKALAAARAKSKVPVDATYEEAAAQKTVKPRVSAITKPLQSSFGSRSGAGNRQVIRPNLVNEDPAGSKTQRDYARMNMDDTPDVEVGVPDDSGPVRFTVRRDEDGGREGSVWKILVFVAVVIIIGVGGVFFVENFIINAPASDTGTDNDANTQQDQTPQQEQFENANIISAIQPDSSADSVTANDLFTDEQSSIGSDSNNIENAVVSQLDHTVFQTFTRSVLTISGLDDGLPQIDISYAAPSKQVRVTIEGVTSEQSLLQQMAIINGNVQSITGSQVDKGILFVFDLAVDSKYAVSVADGNKIVLDIKTAAQLEVPAEAEEPEPTEDPEPVDNTDTTPDEEEPTDVTDPEDTITDTTPGVMPEAPFYENEYSQDKQYVVSDVTGNGLFSETYYYRDDNTSFLFSWAITGVGEDFIPNASAELVDENGKYFIIVEINNLGYSLLHASGKEFATINLSLDGTPLRAVRATEYGDGTAVFKVRIDEPTDYKLYSTLDFEGSQLLTLEIKDLPDSQ